MLQDSLKIYKKISDRRIKDTIKYLSVKYGLAENHIKEIVLKRQFLYTRRRISSGYWRSVKIKDLGTFKFNKRLFDRHFQKVCEESEKKQEEIQELLRKDEINKSK